MRARFVLVAAAAAIAAGPVSLVAMTSFTTPAGACTLHGFKHGYCSREKYLQDNPAEAKANGIEKLPNSDAAAGKDPKPKNK